MRAWRVEHVAGHAGDLHGLPFPEPVERTIWVCEIDRPALVLGSAQHRSTIDERRAGSEGVEVVRRHTGGGAVLMIPGEIVWIDVVIPAGDPLWQRDVGLAFHWLGEAWRTAVSGAWSDAAVHRGALLRSRWSAQACFAGVGPGEVTVGAAKAVGLSQRRTRLGARFQGAAHLRWRPDALARLLALAPGDRRSLTDDLAGAVVTWPGSATDLAAAVVAAVEAPAQHAR